MGALDRTADHRLEGDRKIDRAAEAGDDASASEYDDPARQALQVLRPVGDVDDREALRRQR
ncbi:MAG TPA: hypothetical protein VEH77_00740, partial [Roseiarcus sp.]|nr:hypothetical protein [Roseiarcus sp.]